MNITNSSMNFIINVNFYLKTLSFVTQYCIFVLIAHKCFFFSFIFSKKKCMVFFFGGICSRSFQPKNVFFLILSLKNILQLDKKLLEVFRENV